MNVNTEVLTVVQLANLPVPGLDPSAIDTAEMGAAAFGTNGCTRLLKRLGYRTVEFWLDADTGSGDVALYRYWYPTKSWQPEGPRGATPTTYDTATVAGQVPIRVSVEEVERFVCVVLLSGSITKTDAPAQAIIAEQNR